MTTQPELNAETLRGLASALANVRQGRSSTPRCEPPGQYEINRAMQDVRDILALHAMTDLFTANTKLTKERDALAARVAELREALRKGGFMMTEPHNIGEFRSRKLVIGFEHSSDADDAMWEISRFMKGGES